jgi:hypothetical protein
MIRIYRCFIAKLAIALLLFMQFAVAAYACPGVAGARESSQAMGDASMEMEGGGCTNLDLSDPNLCLQYSRQDRQVTGHASPPLPLLVDLPLLAVVPSIELFLEPALPGVPAEFLARITAPPPFIRFGVFRS